MMPEYIERGAANEALRECVRAYPTSFYNGIEVARAAIHKLPAAADVVEVVRCKDCELWSSCLSKQEKQVLIDTNTDGVCEYWMSDGLMPNDFCSYGKRKEGEE